MSLSAVKYFILKYVKDHLQEIGQQPYLFRINFIDNVTLCNTYSTQKKQQQCCGISWKSPMHHSAGHVFFINIKHPITVN